MASDGPSWKRVVGLARGLEEEENNALVNPKVVDAPGCISMGKKLGSFQMWVRKVKAGGGPGSRCGVRSFYINKT